MDNEEFKVTPFPLFAGGIVAVLFFFVLILIPSINVPINAPINDQNLNRAEEEIQSNIISLIRSEVAELANLARNSYPDSTDTSVSEGGFVTPQIQVNFPLDIPVYPNRLLLQSESFTNNDKSHFYILFVAKSESLDSVVNFYKENLEVNNWKLVQERPEEFYILDFSNNNRFLELSFVDYSEDSEINGISVIIRYIEE